MSQPRRGTHPVRLSEQECDGILRAVNRVFGKGGWQTVWLFGSRCDVQQRGGDIDLVVELDPVPVDTYRLRRNLAIALEDELGERKIDIVIDTGEAGQPFVELAKQKGTPLWIHG